VTLKVKFHDFEIITRSKSVPVAVSSRAIWKAYRWLAAERDAGPQPVRLREFRYRRCSMSTTNNGS
jgi:DNA polymerase-4